MFGNIATSICCYLWYCIKCWEANERGKRIYVVVARRGQTTCFSTYDISQMNRRIYAIPPTHKHTRHMITLLTQCSRVCLLTLCTIKNPKPNAFLLPIFFVRFVQPPLVVGMLQQAIPSSSTSTNNNKKRQLMFEDSTKLSGAIYKTF